MDIKHITGYFETESGLYHSMSYPDMAFLDDNSNAWEIVGGAFSQTETMSPIIEGLEPVLTALCYNRTERTVTVLQDALGGDRLVYYAAYKDKVYISTSLRELLAVSGIDSHLDVDVAREFMHHGFCPDSSTLIMGVRKLRTGNVLRITTSGIGETQLKKSKNILQQSDDEDLFYKSELKVIDEYIDRLYLNSDPVMALSAGFDSNLILDRTIKKGYTPHIITVGDNSKRSEHNTVGRICAIKCIDHSAYTIVSEKTFSDYRDIVNRLEGSVFEPGIFLQYELAKAARRCGATSMICGECADQVFNENFNIENSGPRKKDYKFGSSPFELASGLIIKKSGIMLNSFGIGGLYPYCDHNMINAARSVAELNGRNKRLHINNCKKCMSADHFSLLNKVGGSTSMSSLFSSVDKMKCFVKQRKRSRLYYELGTHYTRRYGPEYDYELIDCLCTHYIDLFQSMFCNIQQIGDKNEVQDHR